MRLTALIAALPDEPTRDIPAKTIAADLVALLPKASSFNVRSSDSVFAAVGPQRAQIRIALGALAIVILIVFALSANLSPGAGNGAKPSAASRRRRHDGFAAQARSLGSRQVMTSRLPRRGVVRRDRECAAKLPKARLKCPDRPKSSAIASARRALVGASRVWRPLIFS